MIRILNSIEQRLESLLRPSTDGRPGSPVALAWSHRAAVSQNIDNDNDNRALATEAEDARQILIGAGFSADDVAEVRLIGTDPRQYAQLLADLCTAIRAGRVSAVAAAEMYRIARNGKQVQALIDACNAAQCTLLLGGVPVSQSLVAAMPLIVHGSN